MTNRLHVRAGRIVAVIAPLAASTFTFTLTLVAASSASAAPSAACPPGQSPRFQLGFAVLKQQLGDLMGQPLECERATTANGDTQQATSTGLALYTKASNAMTFTDGYRRWVLLPEPEGLLYWASPDAEARPFGEPDEAAAPEPEPELDPANDTLLSAAAPTPWVRSIVCPVLYTHEVPAQDTFRRLLQGLLNAGFRPTTLGVVDMALSGGAEPPPGCLLLTFDDALYSQYANGLPVLAALGLPGVFFVMPAFADGVHRYMGAAEIRAVSQAGHEVEAHTCNHPRLPSLARRSYLAFTAELVACKRMIEGIVGAPVPFLAYPYGAYDATVLDGVARAGYRGAFTTRPAATLSAGSPLTLPRIRYDTAEAPAAVLDRIHAAGG